MSQILRGRKKGRPSKADLARRENSGDGYDLRRSHRRRNVRYNFDYDDYLEEDDEEDEPEEERRRSKKMKLVPVLKLNQSRASADPPTTHRGRPAARVGHASDDDDEAEAEGEKEEEEEEEDDEDASEKKPVKKRKINGSAEEDKDYEEEEGEEDREDTGIDDDEESKGKETPNISSCPVIQIESSSETPLPDQKSLELILDKLQKKDVYGVYAEPVDPEELPDYHEIIEQPMDFATVRKKLTNGSYSTLEEFESDVFLICSNAMQYNAPDTVYYKQARTIQEMGKKKFQKIRIKIERVEKELKPEQRIKPLNQNVLEHVGSDFSSGANLANGGTFQNGSVPTQTSGYEKHNYTDGLLGSNISLIDSFEKAEDLSSGRGLVGKFGRKLSAVEDNRRKTYDTSHHLSERSESILSTFDCEIKHLVAVGLHAEYAYARGLARFAATMGPVAWQVASQQIEQALPVGVKFGRGWVGEYEPRPTPMLLLSSSTPEESSAVGTVSEGKPSFVALGAVKPNAVSRKQNPPPRASVEPQSEVPRQVELNLPPDEQSNSPCVPEKQSSGKSDTMAFRSIDVTGLTQYERYKASAINGISPRGLPNGKPSTGLNNRMIDLSMVHTSSQMTRAATCSLPTRQGELQNRDDQARFMRSLSEMHPQVPSDVLSVPFRRSEDSSNGFPFQTFIHQTGHGITDESSHRPTVFPRMVSNSDFNRWRGGITPHVQFKQKQDNLPPDLNIGVQSSPDSPAKQSSHQQPDLALQL